MGRLRMTVGRLRMTVGRLRMTMGRRLRLEELQQQFVERDRLFGAQNVRRVHDFELRTGDRIIVPRRTDPESKWRIIGILAAIPAAIVIATQLHR